MTGPFPADVVLVVLGDYALIEDSCEHISTALFAQSPSSASNLLSQSRCSCPRDLLSLARHIVCQLPDAGRKMEISILFLRCGSYVNSLDFTIEILKNAGIE